VATNYSERILFGRNLKTLVSGIAALAGTRMHVHDGVEIQPFEPARNAEGHLLADAGVGKFA